MEYALIGRTGLRVSRVALGTALLGLTPAESEADALVRRAFDAGINLFDCANTYGNRPSFDRQGLPPAAARKHAEELLGTALKGHRDDVVLCTKVSEPVGPGVNDGGVHVAKLGRSGGGLSRYHIMREVERSLTRLQTDHIDILHAHHPDGDTHIEETLRTFDDLVRQGKVRYVALSTYNGWQMTQAVMTAERFGLARPVLNQTMYNMLYRGVEREVVPAAEELGVALTCFSPFAGGALTGAAALDRQYGGMRRWGIPMDYSAAQKQAAVELDALGKAWGIQPAHLALTWLLGRPTVATAIIGPESVHELEATMGAFEVDVPPELLDELDAVGRPPAATSPFD